MFLTCGCKVLVPCVRVLGPCKCSDSNVAGGALPASCMRIIEHEREEPQLCLHAQAQAVQASEALEVAKELVRLEKQLELFRRNSRLATSVLQRLTKELRR